MSKVRKSKNRKVVEVCPVLAGSPQNRSGGIGSDAGVPRVFDTFHNSKQLASAAFRHMVTEVSTLRIWTRNEL